MMISRRTAIVAGACVALNGAVPSLAEATNFPVTGRKLRWASILPDNGWIGGTVDEIKARVAAIKENKKLDEFAKMAFSDTLARLIPFAEQSDVYLANIKDGVTKSEMVTTIRSDVLNSDAKANFSDEAFRSSLAKKFAESMKGAPGAHLSDTPLPDPLTGRIEFAKEATVGGRQAVSIAIRADLKDGSAFYDVYHFVTLGDGRWHSIWLTVDSEHFSDRLNDLSRMLRAVRYFA
jgi:hypothetical protein